MSNKIAVCQVPDIRTDIQESLKWIEKFTRLAEEKNVSIICFPECFLQGYLTEKILALKYALSIQSEEFDNILKKLATYKPMIVFGLIEQANGLLYNTAVVINGGRLVGKYRKVHLLDGESAFTAGSEYPVFEVNGLIFGINICYDTQFPRATEKLADQGIKLMLCLSNTMMSIKKADKFKHLHVPMRAERAREKKIWLLSADVTGEREGRIAYGSTSAVNPAGIVIEQVPFMETGVIVVEV